MASSQGMVLASSWVSSGRPAWRVRWSNQGTVARPSRASAHNAQAATPAHRRGRTRRAAALTGTASPRHSRSSASPPHHRTRSHASVAGLRPGSVTDSGTATRSRSSNHQGSRAVILAVIPPRTTPKTGGVQTDGTGDLTSEDDTSRHPMDGREATRNRKVVGSNPTSGSKTAGRSICALTLAARFACLVDHPCAGSRPYVATWRAQVLEEPVAGRAAGRLEVLHVGVEVAAGQQHQLLRLTGPLVGLQGQVGRGQVVAGGHHHQQRRGADALQVGAGLVLHQHLDAAQRDLVVPGRCTALAGLAEPLPRIGRGQRRHGQRVGVDHRDHRRRLTPVAGGAVLVHGRPVGTQEVLADQPLDVPEAADQRHLAGDALDALVDRARARAHGRRCSWTPTRRCGRRRPRGGSGPR